MSSNHIYDPPIPVYKLLINIFRFKNRSYNIYDLIEESLTIAKVYKDFYLFCHDSNFDYELFQELRFNHNVMTNQYNYKYYQTIVKYKEFVYKIIFIYLKLTRFPYRISMKDIRNIDYESFNTYHGLFKYLHEYSQIPEKCLTTWINST